MVHEYFYILQFTDCNLFIHNTVIPKLQLSKFCYSVNLGLPVFNPEISRSGKQIIKKGNKNKNLTIKYWQRFDDC